MRQTGRNLGLVTGFFLGNSFDWYEVPVVREPEKTIKTEEPRTLRTQIPPGTGVNFNQKISLNEH
jgi:hypothetical protein